MDSFRALAKAFAKWFIVGATIAFLLQHLKRYGAEVLTLKFSGADYGLLCAAGIVTIAAHLWAGVTWNWILAYLLVPQPYPWAMRTYLRTNLAKYLPGNIWHFYGRVMASQKVGIPLSMSVLSVLLEALLMVAAALGLALASGLGLPQSLAGLGLILFLLHPRCLSPLVDRLERSKLKQLAHLPRSTALTTDELTTDLADLRLPLSRYPWQPLAGELIFVLLRAMGFLLIVLPLNDRLSGAAVTQILSGFSLAWLLGLVVPGAPGGVGVFEASAIVFLQPLMPAPIVLASLAIYRVISTLAEAIGAGLTYGTGVNFPLPHQKC
jgi:uncharacterized membrane protein YbhN (UPF0104 family)